MPKPILIGISPNAEADDVRLALKLLLRPRRWISGPAQAVLAGALKKYFNRRYCYLVNAGRTALFLGLKSLNLKPGDEVIHLDFTCSVVPEAIIKAGGKPVAAADLTRAVIGPKTRAMIVQHTFGVPDNMEKIAAICKNHRLVMIEDLAHSLGAKYRGRLAGTFGDLTMLSFGRDKIISSVFGGALIADRPLSLPSLKYPSRGWIFRQLLHPLIMALAVPTYFCGGKLLIYSARKLGLIVLPLALIEPARLPEALARLALNQWNKLERLNRHRRELAQFYARELKLPFSPDAVYLRFPVKVEAPEKFLALGKKRQMLLGNWYDNKLVNLPTHIRINIDDARRVTALVKDYETT